MCYLIRDRQMGGAAEREHAAVPKGPGRLRPRWIGAIGAALVGGLALAALVEPPTALPLLKSGAPLAEPAPAVPTSSVVERSSGLPMDDGVPSSSETVKAGSGHCNHDL